MQEMLTQLGLNEKEASFYLALLASGPKTALEISKALGETRTNTYMVLNKLTNEKLVDETSDKTKKYAAADPEKLKGLITIRQQQLRQDHAALSVALPELSSMYRLGAHKPGVVYLEGIKGFKAFLNDIYKTRKTLHLFASDIVPEIDDAWAMLEKETRRRAAKGVKTKAIFHKKLKKTLDKNMFKTKGFELRFWANEPVEGEMAIYGNKVAFTAYEPTIITTIITNEVLAKTLQAIFNQVWESAEK